MWTGKFNKEYSEQIKIAEKRFGDINIGEKMLISSPKAIDSYIRKIPFGNEQTIEQMRLNLAKEKGADNTCPVTTGIYLRIAIEASLESQNVENNVLELLPFWRIVHLKLPISKKLSCGEKIIIEQRAIENLAIY